MRCRVPLFVLAMLVPALAAAELETVVAGEVGAKLDHAVQTTSGRGPGRQAGQVLSPKATATPTTEAGSESRSVGTGAGGKRIVDERPTLVLTDTTTGQWPVMSHLNLPAAQNLMNALERAITK